MPQQEIQWRTTPPPLPEIPGVEVREYKGCAGYAVASNGLILSCRGKGGYPAWTKFYPEWRRLKSVHSDGGHPMVTMRILGCQKNIRVYAIVLETFHGPCPPGSECWHLNGDREDNRASNLRWGIPQEKPDDLLRRLLRQTREKLLEEGWGGITCTRSIPNIDKAETCRWRT